MFSHNGSHGLNERIDALSSDLKHVVDELSSAAASLRHRAAEVGSQAASGAGSLVDRTTRAIKQHPIAAIGLAFGAGYVVMRLVRR
jgi:ElaB/YqjD/DUF883 family membrane-anchored ribosome-binding protein